MDYLTYSTGSTASTFNSENINTNDYDMDVVDESSLRNPATSISSVQDIVVVDEPVLWSARQSFLDLVAAKVYMVPIAIAVGVVTGLVIWGAWIIVFNLLRHGKAKMFDTCSRSRNAKRKMKPSSNTSAGSTRPRTTVVSAASEPFPLKDAYNHAQAFTGNNSSHLRDKSEKTEVYRGRWTLPDHPGASPNLLKRLERPEMQQLSTLSTGCIRQSIANAAVYTVDSLPQKDVSNHARAFVGTNSSYLRDKSEKMEAYRGRWTSPDHPGASPNLLNRLDKIEKPDSYESERAKRTKLFQEMETTRM